MYEKMYEITINDNGYHIIMTVDENHGVWNHLHDIYVTAQKFDKNDPEQLGYYNTFMVRSANLAAIELVGYGFWANGGISIE